VRRTGSRAGDRGDRFRRDRRHAPFGRAGAVRFPARATDEEEGEFLADALLHKAELPALWATLAALESVLPEPFAPNYGALVKAARAEVVKKLGGAPR